MNEPLVVIGSGLAAYRLLKAFRALDTQRPCVLVTREDGSFYSKPSLSMGLRQQKSPLDLVMQSAKEMQRELACELYADTEVTEIDTQGRVITLFDGKAIAYGQLVLATGSDPIRLPIPGFDDEAVLSVNQLSDYRVFRDRLREPQCVGIVGAGLVGSEFANDLLEAGHSVEVVALSPYPMDALLIPEAGRVFQQQYEAHGVRYHLAHDLQAIKHGATALQLITKQSRPIEVDTVVSAIGVRPNVALAKAAGIAVDKAIVVDAYGQTSAPDVFALGDCAQVCGLWLVYVPPILACVKALSKTLVGERTAIEYPAMPITVKSTWCPTTIALPTPGVEGAWSVQEPGEHFDARFIGVDSKLHGFILMGEATKKRAQLAKDLPDRLPLPA